jgi:hypothetical protein
MLHSRWINGNLAYWDTHQCRIIDAVGASVVKYLNHFTHFSADDTTRNPTEWKWVSDTANDSVTLPVSSPGGVLQIATGAVDNNETYIQLGSATSATNAPWIIAGAAGVANSKPLYFGARVKCTTHVDGAWFVGLAGEGAAAANFMVDNSGALVDDDIIGFGIVTGTPAAWDITWRNAGQAVQTVAAVAVNADDWHTFEFWYDGATTVTFWIDGTAHATTATTTAATFPFNEEMAPILACKSGDGAAKVLQIDWLNVVQFN